MNTEIYANIVGFPNYQVSTFGFVKNIRTGRVLKPSIRNGYLQVNLRNDGDTSSKNVHKIVAVAFLENPANKRCVDHQDRCKTNNHISNLRWATHTENNQNASIKSNNTSGTTGVSFHRGAQKWMAQIKADGRNINLGYFREKTDAIVARQEAEMTYFGEYRAQTI